jgi:hypothetical protein
MTTFEEKGSDVNVASSLLIDVLSERVDAAMVLSNDSDLHLPLAQAREQVAVATVNPSAKPTAVDLRGHRDTGAGHHWWRRLRPEEFSLISCRTRLANCPDPWAGDILR